MANKKAAAANSGTNLDRARATKLALDLYSTTKPDDRQAFVELSSLLDLATVEAEEHFARAAELERLAAAHRRRAMHALDQLRAYQRMIPFGGQAR